MRFTSMSIYMRGTIEVSKMLVWGGLAREGASASANYPSPDLA